MKRLMVWILVFSMLILLCSCGSQELNGTYTDNVGFSSLEFNGDNVILTTLVKTSFGIYKMEGDTVTINYDNGNSDTFTYDADSDTLSYYGELIYSKENASNSVLTAINENSETEDAEEPEVIGKSEENLSSWEFYEENDTIPTPDSSIKGIFLKEKSDDIYMYTLSDNSYDADMNYKVYAAVLLGCGFTIENEDGMYMIIDESGKSVAAMATAKEGDSYFLLICIL